MHDNISLPTQLARRICLMCSDEFKNLKKEIFEQNSFFKCICLDVDMVQEKEIRTKVSRKKGKDSPKQTTQNKLRTWRRLPSALAKHLQSVIRLREREGLLSGKINDNIFK